VIDEPCEFVIVMSYVPTRPGGVWMSACVASMTRVGARPLPM